jgi:hypothetical protein
MAGMTTAAEGTVAALLLTNIYVGLYTAAPTDAGGGTEVSGGSYTRKGPYTFVQTSTGPTTWKNAAAITFPDATASWGTVTHFGIFTASTGGTLNFWGALAASKTIGSSDRFTIDINGAVVTVD